MAQGAATHIAFLQQLLLSGAIWRRLLVACALGGAVGLEREWRHKDSGLRTNLLICIGAALFTIMSEVLAGNSTPNKGQVAANIVQGVGFLGAGLILHTRNQVRGLTSAATVFCVAAVGMTCGAGMYMGAVIATALLLVVLSLVGVLEAVIGWKRYPMLYEVRAQVGSAFAAEAAAPDRAETLTESIEAARLRMLAAILKTMDAVGQRLHILERDNIAGLERICFSCVATRRVHQKVLHDLRASDATDQVISFPDAEVD